MSRRRSKNPTKAISVTLKQWIIDEIDEILPYKASRSKYIQDSIEPRLKGQKYVSQAETKNLMAALHAREDCDPFLKKLLYQILFS